MTSHRSTARPEESRLFRNRSGLVSLAVCAVLAVVLLTDAVVRAGVSAALLLAPWLLLVLWGVYMVTVASGVRPERGGVLVQNLLRRTFVPWRRVSRIGMRWQIEFLLDDGSVLTCFGGPVQSRPRRLGPGRTLEESTTAADDMVAALRRMKTDVETDPTAAGADADVRRTWDKPAVLALLALLACAAAAIVVAYG